MTSLCCCPSLLLAPPPATLQLPKHRSTSSDAELDAEDDGDDASSSSSTAYPIDTPRLTSRPVRAAAAAAGGGGGGVQHPHAPRLSSTLRPLPGAAAASGAHRPAALPPLAAAAAAAHTQPAAGGAAAAAAACSGSDAGCDDGAATAAAPAWQRRSDSAGMAEACELSESFGHDRSFGDSSVELQGLDSPSHPAAGAHQAAAGRAPDTEASYSSSKASSSRAISPACDTGAEGLPVPQQQPTSASLQHPAHGSTAGAHAAQPPAGHHQPLAAAVRSVA